jgi:pimeloyl-ACP methyl ester carboxylesterase
LDHLACYDVCRIRTVVAVVLLVLSAGAVASCGSAAGADHADARARSPRTSASARPAAGDDCKTSQADGRPVYFGPGSGLAGYLYGTGGTGIVFAHESDGDACDWMPEAVRLAKLGYRTLTVDLNGYGASKMLNRPFSDDVDDAIDFLTGQGVTSIVLVGSSMGGTAVLVAAVHTNARLAAVIALSSPAYYSEADALAAAPRITVPLLMMCGSLDRRFVGDVKDIYAAATATTHKRLVLVDTDAHGKRLVEAGPYNQPRAFAAYAAFLATYAPPNA